VSSLRAVVRVVIQNVTELFHVSSHGHSVLIPLDRGSWNTLVTQSAQREVVLSRDIVALRVDES
jgi:hypothetical protein